MNVYESHFVIVVKLILDTNLSSSIWTIISLWNWSKIRLESVVLSAFGAPASSDPILTLSNQDSLFTVEEHISKSDGSDSMVRFYEDCFISDYGAVRDIGRGDVRVLETATIMYTRLVTS